MAETCMHACSVSVVPTAAGAHVALTSPNVQQPHLREHMAPVGVAPNVLQFVEHEGVEQRQEAEHHIGAGLEFVVPVSHRHSAPWSQLGRVAHGAPGDQDTPAPSR